MKNFFNKYKKAMPFIMVSTVVGTAVMACITLVVMGAVV